MDTALELFKAGRLDQAEQLSQQVLRRSPRDAAALNIVGLVHNARGNYRDAAKSFQRLTELQPGRTEHWINLGTALRSCAKYQDAFVAYGRAAALGENSPLFLYNVGLLHRDLREFPQAEAVLARAAQAMPRDAEIRYYYALTCYDCVHNEEAQRALSDWEQLEGLSAALLADIGILFVQLGDVTAAESALRAALARAPDDLRAHLRLVNLAERINQIDRAREEFARLDARCSERPDLIDEFTRVRALLAQRSGDHALARDQFEQLLARAKDAQDRQNVAFPLSKSLDALGDYSESFRMLELAHAAQMEALNQSAPRFTTLQRDPIDIVNFSVDDADRAQWRDASAPDRIKSPIFVVGFPRSGTTLLEQMLDAHPSLRSMDETAFLQDAIDKLQALGARYPDRLSSLSEAQLDQARALYWDRVATKVSLAPGQRLVDKNPLNMLRLPAIMRLFPNAPIVLVVRHPCDVVLSCYSQHFRAPDFARLCSTLTSLATGYHRAFDFWYRQAAMLTPTVMELQYEHFVENVEGQARVLAHFLSLPWHDAMLDPSRHARERGFISTPSYSQVVQPVSKKAVGRWRNHAEEFAAVLPILSPWLQRWGYQA